MKTEGAAAQIEAFEDAWHALTAVYDAYARSRGSTYSELQVLRFIAGMEDCTQKMICEKTLLPRQTVNSIVGGFVRKGLVQAQVRDADRRTKALVLTERGRQYAQGIFPVIGAAELEAMQVLSPEQRKILPEALRVFADALEHAVAEAAGE